jgi:hypothetical protein
VFLPLLLVMLGFLVGGALGVERILTNLLVDRHRQIAATAAVGVSEIIEGYAHILEALAANPDILNSSPDNRTAVLESASDALEVFNAVVAIFDEEGNELTFAAPDSDLPEVRINQPETFRRVKTAKAPVFSELIFQPSINTFAN